MYSTKLSLGMAVLATVLCAGCAGSSPAPSGADGHAILPATQMRAAATTASLTSCPVTATAQGVGGTGTILQADALSASDMWFEELMYPNDTLDVARSTPGSPPSTVLAPFGATPLYFAYLRVVADNDIWVAANPQTTSTYAIAHWDGSSWRQITLTGSYASTFAPRGLTGLSAKDVWMSGNVQTGTRTALAIAHWNGSAFSVVYVSPYPTNAGPLLELSPTNMWATAFHEGSNVDALHWNGSGFSFHLMPPPPGQSDANTTPVQIAATGPNNIWVAGQHSTSTTIDGRIWRYNGSWQPYLYTPATGSFAIFEGVAPLDATRTVITSEGQYLNQGTQTYAYSGTNRFHSIPNELSQTPTGTDAMVPGTSNFWMPTTTSGSIDYAVVDLVSCR